MPSRLIDRPTLRCQQATTLGGAVVTWGAVVAWSGGLYTQPHMQARVVNDSVARSAGQLKNYLFVRQPKGVHSTGECPQHVQAFR